MSMSLFQSSLTGLCLLLAAGVVRADQPEVRQVEGTIRLLDEDVGMELVAGKLKLETATDWRIVTVVDQSEVVAEPILMLNPETMRDLVMGMSQGGRGQRLQERKQLQSSRRTISSIAWDLRRYAHDQDGKWPTNLAEFQEYVKKDRQNGLPALDHLRFGAEAAPKADEARWGFVSDAPCEAGSYMSGNEKKVGWPENNDVIAIELQPLLDDGKHHVARANGAVDRVPIDEALLARFGWTIKPQREQPAEPADRSVVEYQVIGRFVAEGRSTFIARSDSLDQELRCEWEISDLVPETGEKAVEARKLWGTRRILGWMSMSSSPGKFSPPMQAFMQVNSKVYRGVAEFLTSRWEQRQLWRWRDDDETTSLFGLLGGQAAIRETLQMQGLNQAQGDAAEAVVELDKIEGVNVKSHPYAGMLGDRVGGRLPLADAVPQDRLLLYAAKPASLIAFLDEGASFLSDLGTVATGRDFDYALVERYLGRLGLTLPMARQLLQSGMVAEMAVFMPDLFLIEGTEVTLICRVPRLKELAAVMQLGDLAGAAGQPLSLKSPLNGAELQVAVRDDLLILGTHAGEVASVCNLLAADGENSLGQSAEFRFMLTELPLQDTTRLYLYFSDSFIRRLVGPEVKIGQLRRMKTIARLHLSQAAHSLWQADGKPGDKPGVLLRENLAAGGYVDEAMAEDGDLVWHEDGRVESHRYGSLRRIKTLLQSPFQAVTQGEAEAYGTYRERYTRFWSQFFDPIAIRLDDTDDGSLELSTFILPLIESSLYNSLRHGLATEKGGFLRSFDVVPAVPLMLSFNINENSWDSFLVDMLPEEVGLFHLF